MGQVFTVRNMRDGAPAQKKLIASFSGEGFVAEREDDKLNIFLVGAEDVATGAITGDRTRQAGRSSGFQPMTPAKLQALNEQSRRPSFHDKMCGCTGK